MENLRSLKSCCNFAPENKVLLVGYVLSVLCLWNKKVVLIIQSYVRFKI